MVVATHMRSTHNFPGWKVMPNSLALVPGIFTQFVLLDEPADMVLLKILSVALVSFGWNRLGVAREKLLHVETAAKVLHPLSKRTQP